MTVLRVIVSQRRQCDPGHSAQKEDEDREAQEARFRQDQEARFRQDQEARFRQDQEARLRQDQEDRLRQDQEARLQGYERLKREAAARLANRDRLGRDVFGRGDPEPVAVNRVPEFSATLYDLLSAYATRRQEQARSVVREAGILKSDIGYEEIIDMSFVATA